MLGIPGTVEQRQDNNSKMTATVEFSVNMTCNNCEQKIKNVLMEKGIDDVKVSVSKIFRLLTFYLWYNFVYRYTTEALKMVLKIFF